MGLISRPYSLLLDFKNMDGLWWILLLFGFSKLLRVPFVLAQPKLASLLKELLPRLDSRTGNVLKTEPGLSILGALVLSLPMHLPIRLGRQPLVFPTFISVLAVNFEEALGLAVISGDSCQHRLVILREVLDERLWVGRRLRCPQSGLALLTQSAQDWLGELPSGLYSALKEAGPGPVLLSRDAPAVMLGQLCIVLGLDNLATHLFDPHAQKFRVLAVLHRRRALQAKQEVVHVPTVHCLLRSLPLFLRELAFAALVEPDGNEILARSDLSVARQVVGWVRPELILPGSQYLGLGTLLGID